jgi:hypothetical protein
MTKKHEVYLEDQDLVLTESQIIKKLTNYNSLHTMDLFMNDNNADNFSKDFHVKFNDLYNSTNTQYNAQKDLDNDYSMQQKRLYPDDVIA